MKVTLLYIYIGQCLSVIQMCKPYVKFSHSILAKWLNHNSQKNKHNLKLALVNHFQYYAKSLNRSTFIWQGLLKVITEGFFLFLSQEKNCLQNIQIHVSPTVLHSQTDTDQKSICNQKEQVSHPTSLVVFHILFPNDSMKFNKQSIY